MRERDESKVLERLGLGGRAWAPPRNRDEFLGGWAAAAGPGRRFLPVAVLMAAAAAINRPG